MSEQETRNEAAAQPESAQSESAASEAPKISLLIPIYNVEKYLRECLESAQNQTLRDIEVICINDGSTDGSRQIIEGFLADPRFKVIDKPNSGYGASMNMGLDAATGEYVGILESDDFLDADALEHMYDLAQQSDADVVRSDFYLYWSQPEPRDHKFGWVAKGKSGHIDPYVFQDVFYLQPSIWAAIYKRSFLNKNGIRFLETPGASYQDTSFNFKVWASTHNVMLTERAFLHYRQDNETSSINSAAKVYCVCDEYDEMMKYIEADPERAVLRPTLAAMRYDTYIWNYLRLTEELQREFVMRMAEDFRRDDAAGDTDLSLLDPWKVVDRNSIVEDPMRFHEQKVSGGKRGKLNTLKSVYNAGGLPLVMKSVKKRLGRGWY